MRRRASSSLRAALGRRRSPARATLAGALATLALFACSAPAPAPLGDAGAEPPAVDAGTNRPRLDSGVSVDAGPPPDCGALALCGVTCADLDADPDNCGACGVSCVIPDAAAACVAGACAIGRCAPGFEDLDGVLANGCEAEVLCVADEPCTASCGVEGRTVCDGAEVSCAPPPEVCNLADDNCNGTCDEGQIPGCRRGVHRSNGNGHLFTTDLGAATQSPYRLESENYFYLLSEAAAGTRPVFLCRKRNGKHLVTSDTACETAGGVVLELGFWATAPACDSTPLYRLYHGPSGNHFYTVNANERDNAVNNLGYVAEGVVGHVWRAP